MIDFDLLPGPNARGYDVKEQGSDLSLILRKDLDTHENADRWAFPITTACVGPYQEVRIDCSGHTTLSSTIIAGLVHLADHFTEQQARVVLTGASERVHRTMQMMHLDGLFAFG